MFEDIHWRKYASRFRVFPAQIPDEMDPGVRIIICIPVCAEPDVLKTLDSLYLCSHDGFNVEVILLFNLNSKNTKEEIELHRQSWRDCLQWVNQHPKDGLRFMPVFMDELPDPSGGVGWARKLVMDEAARRLDAQGIIVCLDADCTVSENYFEAIFQHFLEFRTYHAASIFIEHKLDHLSDSYRDAIMQYELHLRYLVLAQRWCGHPFAAHTIGSAMAVRRQAYLSQGGMNTRSAGEDFYFLQKFIEIGSHMEISNTTVYPSARISSRVPFGTGKAMLQIIHDKESWVTTDYNVFFSIRPLFQSLDTLRNICLGPPLESDYYKIRDELGLSDAVTEYLQHIEFMDACREVARQTSGHAPFRKRFFRYFNAFRMIKFMHYMRDYYFPDVPVMEGAISLAREIYPGEKPVQNLYECLLLFRRMERGHH